MWFWKRRKDGKRERRYEEGTKLTLEERDRERYTKTDTERRTKKYIGINLTRPVIVNKNTSYIVSSIHLVL